MVDDDEFWTGGVEDLNMYPVRGQTVLIRAPWIKVGVGYASKDGEWAYIIPRRSGEVRPSIPSPFHCR